MDVPPSAPGGRLVFSMVDARQTADALHAQSLGMAAAIDALSHHQVTLEGQWTGLTADAYQREAFAWERAMRPRVEALDSISSSLDQIADEFEATSRRVAAMWQGAGRG